MTTESVAPEAVQAGTTDIPATVRRLRETFPAAAPAASNGASSSCRRWKN